MKVKKLILLSLTLGLTFPGAHLFAGGWMSRERQEDKERVVTNAADNQENNNNAQEAEAKTDEIKMDPFSLPRDLQNTLLEMLWFENNPEEFVKNIEAIFKATKSLRKRFAYKSLPSLPEYHGYSGTKIPILFYTLDKNNKPIIREMGAIIGNAHPPSKWYDPTEPTPSTNELFLNGADQQYHATITSSCITIWGSGITILKCSISIIGTIAIYWIAVKGKYRVSLFTINDIKNNGTLTLDKNAHNTFQVKDKKPHHTYPFIRGILFNLCGDQLALVFANDENEMDVEILDTPIPLTNKPLTQEQIAKRLMLPTTQLKEQLKLQDAPNKENSDNKH